MSMESKTTCVCGCDGIPKEGNRFILGHSRRKNRSCYICGKRVWRYINGQQQKLTCSQECAKISFARLNSERQIGSKHRAWNGGYKESVHRQNEIRKIRINTDPVYAIHRKKLSHKSYLNYLNNHPGKNKIKSKEWYMKNVLHGRARATLNNIGVKYRENKYLFTQSLEIFKLNHQLKEAINGWRLQSK